MIYYNRDGSMKNIELVLSEGIKNGKWIDISYINNPNLDEILETEKLTYDYIEGRY